MAQGDLTLVNHGTYNLSGGTLKTAADSLNIKISGGAIHLIPTGNGQVELIETTIA